MSSSSFMEKLLDGVEVEWKALGEVGTWYGGGTPSKGRSDFWENGNIPWVSPKDMGRPIVDSSEDYITEDAIKNSSTKLVPANSIAIVVRSSILDKVLPSALIPVPVALNQDMKAVLPNSDIMPRYIAHMIRSRGNDILRAARKTGGSVASIDSGKLFSFLIPIPCPNNPKKSLEVQAEIVRILDAFTAMTTELTTELNLRKKQYNYYRDQLLSFEEGEVEWKTLGDVTNKWYSGGTPTAGNPEYYDDGEIPWLRTQEVKFADIENTEVKITESALKNSSAKWIPTNCVIIAISGATAGRSAINKIPLTTNQHCGCLEIDDTKALYRYVFHWVSYNYENFKALGQGARGDLNSSIIKGFKIPIPYADDPEKSLAEQARIVAILDKFDALTNSITEGLPREIELRQKQYEYYRDLLLSFPKPNSEEVA